MIAAVVDWDALLQVVWVSLVTGVGISALFSLVIYGTDKAGDLRRHGRGGLATAYATFAVVAFLLFAVGVALGVQTMIEK